MSRCRPCRPTAGAGRARGRTRPPSPSLSPRLLPLAPATRRETHRQQSALESPRLCQELCVGEGKAPFPAGPWKVRMGSMCPAPWPLQPCPLFLAVPETVPGAPKPLPVPACPRGGWCSQCQPGLTRFLSLRARTRLPPHVAGSIAAALAGARGGQPKVQGKSGGVRGSSWPCHPQQCQLGTQRSPAHRAAAGAGQRLLDAPLQPRTAFPGWQMGPEPPPHTLRGLLCLSSWPQQHQGRHGDAGAAEAPAAIPTPSPGTTEPKSPARTGPVWHTRAQPLVGIPQRCAPRRPAAMPSPSRTPGWGQAFAAPGMSRSLSESKPATADNLYPSGAGTQQVHLVPPWHSGPSPGPRNRSVGPTASALSRCQSLQFPGQRCPN